MYFNFSIFNFFSKKQKWDKLFSFYKRLSKHKHLEFECFYSNWQLFQIEFKFQPIREDHAGGRILINILGWEAELRFYDNRHWDYKNNCWEEKG
jgi:hypothetical protein